MRGRLPWGKSRHQAHLLSGGDAAVTFDSLGIPPNNFYTATDPGPSNVPRDRGSAADLDLEATDGTPGFSAAGGPDGRGCWTFDGTHSWRRISGMVPVPEPWSVLVVFRQDVFARTIPWYAQSNYLDYVSSGTLFHARSKSVGTGQVSRAAHVTNVWTAVLVQHDGGSDVVRTMVEGESSWTSGTPGAISTDDLYNLGRLQLGALNSAYRLNGDLCDYVAWSSYVDDSLVQQWLNANFPTTFG